MLIIKQVQLFSDQIRIWLQKDTAARSILNSVIGRIRMQVRRARYREIYAYKSLVTIHNALQECGQALTEEYEKRRQVLLGRDPQCLTHLKPVMPINTEYRTGSALVYELIECLQKLDSLLYVLSISKMVGLFKYQQQYHRAQRAIQEIFFKPLFKILKNTPLNAPRVSLDDYLEEKPAYQTSRAVYGAIDPNLLFEVIQAYYAPVMAIPELEKVVTALKDKKKQLTSQTPLQPNQTLILTTPEEV